VGSSLTTPTTACSSIRPERAVRDCETVPFELDHADHFAPIARGIDTPEGAPIRAAGGQQLYASLAHNTDGGIGLGARRLARQQPLTWICPAAA